MPSLATHFLFGQDLSKVTDHSVENIIKRSPGAFCLGLQGPDIFFYDIVRTALGPNKKIGSLMHTKRTDTYFYNYMSYLKENNLCKNAAVTSYFYGILCHYSLDCAAHPFIYYHTNLHDTSSAGCNKSLAAHCRLESDIDALLYNDHTSQNICDIRRSSFMNISTKEVDMISPVIANAISKTYNCSFSASHIKRSIHRGLTTNALFNSRYGIKASVLAVVEKPIVKSHLGSSLMFNRTLPARNCLNENHEEWRLPFNNQEMHDSFSDLYNSGLSNADRLITLANHTLNDYCDISDFASATGGMSYHTGIHWKSGDNMKYLKSTI